MRERKSDFALIEVASLTMQIQQTLKPRGSFGEIARYQRFVVVSSFVLPVRAVSKLLICGVSPLFSKFRLSILIKKKKIFDNLNRHV